MDNFGFIKRQLLVCGLVCLISLSIEALDIKEAQKLNRKIEIMVGGLRSQLITAVLEIEELRASNDKCKCEQHLKTGKYSVIKQFLWLIIYSRECWCGAVFAFLRRNLGQRLICRG